MTPKRVNDKVRPLNGLPAPQLCAYCGAELKFVPFITEHACVRRILDHLNMPQPRGFDTRYRATL